jgi:hypothetical protein
VRGLASSGAIGGSSWTGGSPSRRWTKGCGPGGGTARPTSGPGSGPARPGRQRPEQLPAYVLKEDAVQERLVDTGSGLFLLPGILADEEAE